uniref:Intraflagellar transport protein 74 homolog n=1 Tax=Angiostrongylus cantonensis TaxID=6313 RepID=A0A0K0DNK3_ANGCA
MRQVHDKSYYMGVLRVKMNQLTAEIAHLEEIYQKGERDRSDLDAYEQRARKSATELKELQGKLIDYNVLVDRMHMNHEMNEIEAEARREKETADEIEVTVQELFNERQAREIEIEEIATEIDEQKRLNQAILAGMTLNMELEAFTDDIVRMLQKISANIMKLETNATSNIVGRDELLLLQDNASPTELQNLHVRLQEEMMLLEETETRLKSEIATLERRLGELSEEYASYSDLDKISVEAEKNIEKLEQRRDELESALPEHDAHCERLRERLRELSEKLENNPRYATQKTLLRKLEMLKESNARLRAEVEAREGETNYEPIKAEVRRLREQYNEYLVNTIGRK